MKRGKKNEFSYQYNTTDIINSMTGHNRRLNKYNEMFNVSCKFEKRLNSKKLHRKAPQIIYFPKKPPQIKICMVN